MTRLIALNDRFWPALTLALAAVVGMLTLQPVTVDLPQAVSNSLLHHFVAFGALAFPVALARPPRWPLYLALIAGWGAAIEIIQPHVGRQGDPIDAVVNVLGILAATAAGFGLRALAGARRPHGWPRRS